MSRAIFPMNDWEPDRPSSNTSLWRYIDFTQFVAILEREALWFSRAAGFFDKYEGALPKSILDEIAESVSDRFQNSETVVSAYYDALRHSTYLNCWHEADDETAAMWQVYRNQGKEVAIKTRVSNLEDTLTSDFDVTTGRVKYIDYSSPEGFVVNRISPFFYKRYSFKPEAEFRVVISDFHPPDGIPVDEQFAEIVAEDSDVGKPVSVEPSKLIKEIRISPVAGNWVMPLVEDVLGTYGLDDVPVKPSKLTEEPFD